MNAPAGFSWLIFLAIFAIFSSSLIMFLLLVRRWTTQRQWVSLAEWARQRKFKFQSNEISELPASLAPLKNLGLQISMHVCRESVALLQLETQATPAPDGATRMNRWNVLVRKRVKKATTPAGLRPANSPSSLLDLFGLSQFPTLALGHRFSVLSTTSSAARALAESGSRTLLPADLGLLLVDDWIVLDFSVRPFDPIELDRMTNLAQQLSQML